MADGGKRRGGFPGKPESEILRRLAEQDRTDLELVWYAGGTQKPSRWRCLNGHGEFERPANEIVNKGGRCKKCSDIRLGKMRRLTEETVRERLADQPEVQLVSYAGTASPKSVWRCPQGHEWKAAATQVLGGGGRCPYCPRPHRPEGRPVTGGAPPFLTEEEVLLRLGDRTDVVLVEYAGTAIVKSLWRCPEGHEWRAKAGNVIAGGSCPRCVSARTAAKNRSSEDYVRQRLVELGRDRDVELVEYAGAMKNPASLWRCKHCGETWRARAGHVLKSAGQRSSSCPHCAAQRGGEKQRLSAAQVRKALAEQGRDDVILVRYGGTTKEPSDWTCPKGHTWTTVATNVLKGSGCWDCVGTGFPVTEAKVRERLAHRTDLILLEYGGSVAHHPSRFRCVAAGHEWSTQALNLLKPNHPSGCPACQTYGFSPGRPAWVYLLHNPDFLAIKVGITNNPDQCVERQHRKNGWSLVRLWSVGGWDAPTIETQVIQAWRQAGFPPGMPKGTDGFSETVST